MRCKQEAAHNCNSRKLILRMITTSVLVLLTSIAAVSYSTRLGEAFDEEPYFNRLHQGLAFLQATQVVDSIRTQALSRIGNIMERFNPELPEPLKRAIAQTVYEMSLKYEDLSVDLICATITQESGWRPDAVSSAGAMGLMQIIPPTGRFLAYEEGLCWERPEEILFDPVYNIRLGCRYLSALVEMYGVEGGLAAYNSGERRAALWLASNRDMRLLHRETRIYVPSILSLVRQFASEDGVM